MTKTLALLAMLCAVPAMAEERTITVSGTGTVSAQPDVAIVVAGVVSQDADPAAAQDRLSAGLSLLPCRDRTGSRWARSGSRSGRHGRAFRRRIARFAPDRRPASSGPSRPRSAARAVT